MFEEMSRDEILDLWDAVAASPPSDSGASIKALEFAGVWWMPFAQLPKRAMEESIYLIR